MAKVYITKEITAENTFSDPCKIVGNASFVLSGTWDADVIIQRTKDGQQTWDNLTDEDENLITFSSNVTANLFEATDSDDVLYRFGVATGGFNSGTVVGVISQ